MKMRQMWVWMLLMALASVNDRSHCCLDEERVSLLEIKAWFNHAGAPVSYYLEAWDKEHFNCCNWDRVVCDNTTNRVIELHLSFVNYDDLKAVEDLDLNASLFLPFKELEILDLSVNQLVGGLKNQGFQVLALGLRNLKELYLSSNKLNDNILSSFNGFSTLKSLDLSGNMFTESANLNGFQVLASGLRNLEELYLRYNEFNDNMLSSFSGFSTLKSLDLSGNRFAGSTGLNGLRNLETLYLDSTDFMESILIESLGALPSLKTLHASDSNFTHFGKGLWNSSSLEEVVLDGSSLPASFLRNIGPLSTLKVLSLTGVDFNSTLPAQGIFFNSSTLEELYLDGTSLPLNFLQNIGALPDLKVLSVVSCDLNDTLPAQGWCELNNLEQLYLPGNNLKGILPPCLGNL